MTQKKRIIFHVDMDHFYTAVEEAVNPQLRGKPVVVGADPKGGKGRGVVHTCNYEARKFGAKSGMPISRAWKLCPDAVYLPVNYALYSQFSKEIMHILRKLADKFEQWGIDEAFLDVTSKVKEGADAATLAHLIKKEISQKTGLTCSIGISSNKLVAKIASDFQKPDGLTVVKEENAEKFLSPLPVRKLLWVGRKTEQKLASMGIKTIGDLAHCDPTVLAEVFGVIGAQLHFMARGKDESEVEERTEIKSISRDTTFDEDTTDFKFVLETLHTLAEDVCKEALDRKLCFKTITVRIRYENFETHTRGRTLPFMTNRLNDLEKTADELIRCYLKPGREIRLVGVRVSNFVSAERQKTLM